MRSNDEMYKLGASKTWSLPWDSILLHNPLQVVETRFARFDTPLPVHADYRLRRRLPLAGGVHGHFNSAEWDRHGGVPPFPRDFVLSFLEAPERATESSTTVSAGE